MDSLSTKLNRAASNGTIRGIGITFHKEITHNLFVDDILFFAKFCKASGMMANHGKSCIYYGNGDMELVEWIGSLFNFRFAPLDMGFKYLGFYMKPNKYGIKDWKWLIEKAERRIGG